MELHHLIPETIAGEVIKQEGGGEYWECLRSSMLKNTELRLPDALAGSLYDYLEGVDALPGGGFHFSPQLAEIRIREASKGTLAKTLHDYLIGTRGTFTDEVVEILKEKVEELGDVYLNGTHFSVIAGSALHAENSRKLVDTFLPLVGRSNLAEVLAARKTLPLLHTGELPAAINAHRIYEVAKRSRSSAPEGELEPWRTLRDHPPTPTMGFDVASRILRAKDIQDSGASSRLGGLIDQNGGLTGPRASLPFVCESFWEGSPLPARKKKEVIKKMLESRAPGGDVRNFLREGDFIIWKWLILVGLVTLEEVEKNQTRTGDGKTPEGVDQIPFLRVALAVATGDLGYYEAEYSTSNPAVVPLLIRYVDMVGGDMGALLNHSTGLNFPKEGDVMASVFEALTDTGNVHRVLLDTDEGGGLIFSLRETLFRAANLADISARMPAEKEEEMWRQIGTTVEGLVEQGESSSALNDMMVKLFDTQGTPYEHWIKEPCTTLMESFTPPQEGEGAMYYGQELNEKRIISRAMLSVCDETYQVMLPQLPKPLQVAVINEALNKDWVTQGKQDCTLHHVKTMSLDDLRDVGGVKAVEKIRRHVGLDGHGFDVKTLQSLPTSIPLGDIVELMGSS